MAHAIDCHSMLSQPQQFSHTYYAFLILLRLRDCTGLAPMWTSSSPHLSWPPSPGCLHGRWPPHLGSHLMTDSSPCCRCPSHSTQALTAQVELLACVDALFILCELILHVRHTHTGFVDARFILYELILHIRHTHTGFVDARFILCELILHVRHTNTHRIW